MIIQRIISTENGTFGVIRDGVTPFALTLERQWLDNKPNISCIPAGKYTCKRFSSKAHPDTFEICNVKGRTGILFHTGNLMTHSAGCVLIGEQFETLGGKPAILASKKGFTEFMTRLGNVDEFELIIKDGDF
jgi:hypothetical protein